MASSAPKLYDPELAWQEEVALSRAADPLLSDAGLLAGIKQQHAHQGADKFTSEWWKTWRKNTNIASSTASTCRAARIPPSPPRARPRVRGAAFSTLQGHASSDPAPRGSHVTALSLGALYEVGVADLLAQKRRGVDSGLVAAETSVAASTLATDSLVSAAGMSSAAPASPPTHLERRPGRGSSGTAAAALGSAGSAAVSAQRAESAPVGRTTAAVGVAGAPTGARTQGSATARTRAFEGTSSLEPLAGGAAATSGDRGGSGEGDGGEAAAAGVRAQRPRRPRPVERLEPPRVAGAVTFGSEARGPKYSTAGPGPGTKPLALTAVQHGAGNVKFGSEVRGKALPGGGGATDASYKLPDTVGLGCGPAALVDLSAPRPWDAALRKEKRQRDAAEAAARDAARQQRGGAGEGSRRHRMGRGDGEDDNDHDDGGGDEEEDDGKDDGYGSDAGGSSQVSGFTPKRASAPRGSGPKEDPVFAATTFGFGCSMEEHVLYGHCLDGRCCKRSHLERVLNKRTEVKRRSEVRARAAAKGLSRAAADLEASHTPKARAKTALHYACEKNKLEVVHELLLSGARVDEVDEFGNTPLALAAARGHVRVTQRLLVNAQFPLVSLKGFVTRRLSPTVNVTDDDGRTPLHRAAAEGHHVIVKLLLEVGGAAAHVAFFFS